MKKLNITFLLTLLMSMVGLTASAYDIEVKNADGVTIYYNYINEDKELAVTFYSYDSSMGTPYSDYTGNVVIPEDVTFMNRTRKVTSIESGAFWNCSGLTSVTIPNSVTSIGSGAFYGCFGLTSVTIPNSVISIGNSAFSNCRFLASVTIGSGVTSIESGAFWNCGFLASVTIPNSVESIGNSAFSDCTSLTSVTIGSGVTSIGKSAFNGADIPTIISLIENPSAILGKTVSDRTFSKNTFNNAALYVPKGTIDKYKATDGWKDFLFIEESTPTAIKDVKQDATTESPATIYNIKGELQNAPLNALPHGIYIVNDKKVIK